MNRIFSVCAALGLSVSAQSQGYFIWTADEGDFYQTSNWDLNRIPGLNDIVIINNDGTAIIGENEGERQLSGFELGETEDTYESGHIIMNGGTFRIGEFEGDSKIHIGEGTELSSFIMNGGTLFYDGPDDPAVAGSRSSAGVNENDWEVGEHGKGRFEMHDDAVFRAGDDLKISENSAGNSSVLVDGNARLSVGSGIGMSNGGSEFQELFIGGNAIVDSGNSMGAGHPDGHTDEGYLTMAIGGGNARVVVQDNGTFNFRVLSSRQGVSEFTIKDNGQVHIFDVFAGRGNVEGEEEPDRPVESGGFRSSLSSGAATESTLLLQDNAIMTVNAENGIGISGPRGGADAGGSAILIVRDSATFRVEQYLALGTGTQSETTNGTLEIRGSNASVFVGENLNMAVDTDGEIPTTDATNEDGSPVPGKSTLKAVITSDSHGTLEVGGTARIAQGILKVNLDGYTPKGGESFTLIQGGTIEGEFHETDFSEAPLAEGLSWEIDYSEDAVKLNILGETTGGPTELTISGSRNEITITWEGEGSLMSAEDVTGPWMVIEDASSPFTTATSDSSRFYQVGFTPKPPVIAVWEYKTSSVTISIGWEPFTYDSNNEMDPILLRRSASADWDKNQKWEVGTSSETIPKGWEPFAYDSNDKFDPFWLRRLTSDNWDKNQEWEIDRSSQEIPAGWKPFAYDSRDKVMPFLLCRRFSDNWDGHQKWVIKTSSEEIPEGWEPFAYDSENGDNPIFLRRQIR